MPVNVTADIAAALRALEAMSERLADTGPWADGVYADFLKVEQRRFDEEGPGWAPLAASTLAEKARKGYPSTILEATGMLRASLTEHGAEGAVFQPVISPAGTQVTMGTDYVSPTQGGAWADTALAAFHQQGTSRMPARPVIADDTVLLAAWTASLAAWLRTGEVAALRI